MHSAVNYISPDTDKPEVFLFEPPPGVPRQFPTVRHVVQVHNGREDLDALSLDRQGFVLRNDPRSVVADFYDEKVIEEGYYANMAGLIKRETGASDVVVFDHTYRSSRELRPGESDANQPVVNAHSDYTNESGPARAADVCGDRYSEAIEERRYLIVNVWRPINGTVEQKPLALCDIRSMYAEDFVAARIRFPNGRNGGVMAIRHRDEHRWFYFPKMSVDEVLLFKSFDPRAFGANRFGAHCAVEEPGMTGDERTRESIEIRAVALFDR
ncbi:MAG: CmcJ/NvfI family oxidoreductase [Gammaproteobacteria bacterium]|jgi:hypothetical protein